LISATPFHANGDLDLASLDRLIEFYLGHGARGLTILGMMGEAKNLTHEESSAVVQRTMSRVRGRVPVIVGVSAPDQKAIHSLSVLSMEAGAAGVMVAPTGPLADDDAVYRYFAEVFATLGPDIPVIVQDYPQSTGVKMSAGVIGRMIDDFEQFVMFKHEDCPGLAKLTELRKRPGARQVSILVGNGGLYLPCELRRGADGAMTGFAFPEMLSKVCALAAEGDYDSAENLFDVYLPLIRYEQQPQFGLAMRKEVLFRRGAIASATLRVPMPRLDATDHKELDGLLLRLRRRLETLPADFPKLAAAA